MMFRVRLLLIVALIYSVTWAQDGSAMLGFYGGIGSTLPTGSLCDNFDGCVTFGGGITGAYHNVTLKADIYYGQPSFNRQNIFSITDAEGRDAQLNAAASATQLGVSCQLGYNITLSRLVSITPSTGIYWTRYSWNVNDIEWSKNPDGLDVFQAINTSSAKLSNVGWTASIDIDIRLHDKYVADAPLLGGQSRYSSCLRITPWISPVNFNKSVPSVKGCFVGVNLSYAGLLSSLTQ